MANLKKGQIMTVLESKYNEIIDTFELEKPLDANNINMLVKEVLHSFLIGKNKPAIYCNGGHTKMLMADFMFELKNVKIIIDNYHTEFASGFKIISDEKIEEFDVDAIIISSYKFRKEISEKLGMQYPKIPVLDIYEEIQKKGVNLQADYYYNNHPFQHYHIINELNRLDDSEEKYKELVTKYLHIKDVRMAFNSAKKLVELYPKEKNKKLAKDIRILYELEIELFDKIDKNNVLLLCLDGMRRQDMSQKCVPKLMDVISKKGCFYDNTYSYSTSTYESLIPVYSENTDFKTEYYKHNKVDSSYCRFIGEALKQDRKIYFYTDMDYYIYDKKINYSNSFQTITEKLWYFLIDAINTDNGLFLIHELYETHYSFSNPYTREKLLAEGTAMLFDFLPQKGGKLRADYISQHNDAMKYIDDTLSSFLGKSNFKILLYADHGNLLLSDECTIREIDEIKLTCSEEWIQVPFVIFNNGNEGKRISDLHSLMQLNSAVICMMNNKIYRHDNADYIKVGRSELYNPDFRMLYKMINQEQDLLAFECFVFKDGIKIVIFSDGNFRIYKGDARVFNQEMYKEYIVSILPFITVSNNLMREEV